jgi:hypothetical protein
MSNTVHYAKGQIKLRQMDAASDMLHITLLHYSCWDTYISPQDPAYTLLIHSVLLLRM